MSSNVSLANPGTSLHFDGQALQNQQEEEIEREEQLQQNELRQLLTTAFDELDDDVLSVASSEGDSGSHVSAQLDRSHSLTGEEGGTSGEGAGLSGPAPLQGSANQLQRPAPFACSLGQGGQLSEHRVVANAFTPLLPAGGQFGRLNHTPPAQPPASAPSGFHGNQQPPLSVPTSVGHLWPDPSGQGTEARDHYSTQRTQEFHGNGEFDGLGVPDSGLPQPHPQPHPLPVLPVSMATTQGDSYLWYQGLADGVQANTNYNAAYPAVGHGLDGVHGNAAYPAAVHGLDGVHGNAAYPAAGHGLDGVHGNADVPGRMQGGDVHTNYRDGTLATLGGGDVHTNYAGLWGGSWSKETPVTPLPSDTRGQGLEVQGSAGSLPGQLSEPGLRDGWSEDRATVAGQPATTAAVSQPGRLARNWLDGGDHHGNRATFDTNVALPGGDNFDHYTVHYKKAQLAEVSAPAARSNLKVAFLTQEKASEPATQLSQLQLLYESRGRQLEDLTTQLEQQAQESARERRRLKHLLSVATGEKEGVEGSLRGSQQLLQQARQEQQETASQLTAAQAQVAALTHTKEQLTSKVQSAELAVETLTHRVSGLEGGDSVGLARRQHEAAVESLQQRHEAQLQDLRTQLDKLQVDRDRQEAEACRVRDQLRAAEEGQVWQGATVNQLTRSLEESQRRCHALLDTASSEELCKLRAQLQQALVSKKMADDMCTNLQGEIQDLREELSLFESATSLGALTPSPPDDSMADLGIRKTLDFSTPEASNNESEGGQSLGTMVTKLRKELERCVLSNKAKRAEVVTLTQDRKVLQEQASQLQQDLASLKQTVASQQVKLSGYEERLDGGMQPSAVEARLKRDVENTRLERQALVKDVEEYKARLSEMGAEEERMSQANASLKQQLAAMVTQHDTDLTQAVERCRAACEDAHQLAREKLEHSVRSQLFADHQEALLGYKEQLSDERARLQTAQEEVSQVKEMYLAACSDLRQAEDRAQAAQQHLDNALDAERKKWEAEQETKWAERLEKERENWERSGDSLSQALSAERERWEAESQQLTAEKGEELSTLEAELRKREAELKEREEELNKREAEKEAELKEREKELQKLDEDLKGKEIEKEAELKEKAVGLEVELKKLEADLKDREAELTKLRTEKETGLEAERSKWEAELSKVRAELSKVKAGQEAESRRLVEAERASWQAKTEQQLVAVTTELDQCRAQHQATLVALETKWRQDADAMETEWRRKAAAKDADLDLHVEARLAERTQQLQKELSQDGNRRLEAAERERREAQTAVVHLQKQLSESQAAAQSSSEEAQRWQQAARAAEAETEGLKAGLEAERRRAVTMARAECQADLDRCLKDSRVALDTALDQARQRHQQEMGEMEERLQQELSALRATGHGQVSMATSQEDEVSLFSNRLQDRRQRALQVRTLAADKARMERELQAAREEKAAVLTELDTVQAQAEELRGDVDALTSDLDALTADRDALRHQLEEGEISKLQQAVRSLAEGCRATEAERVRQVAALEGAVEGERGRVVQLERALRAVNRQHAADVSRLQDTLADRHRHQLEALAARLEQSQSEHAVAMETVQRQHEADKRALADKLRTVHEAETRKLMEEVGRQAQRALANTPTQTDADESLCSLKDHYFTAMQKIKGEVMAHIERSNERAAAAMRAEIRLERQRVTRHLRNRCKARLYTALTAHGAQGYNAGSLWPALDAVFDSLTSSCSVTPSSSANPTPRSSEEEAGSGVKAIAEEIGPVVARDDVSGVDGWPTSGVFYSLVPDDSASVTDSEVDLRPTRGQGGRRRGATPPKPARGLSLVGGHRGPAPDRGPALDASLLSPKLHRPAGQGGDSAWTDSVGGSGLWRACSDLASLTLPAESDLSTLTLPAERDPRRQLRFSSDSLLADSDVDTETPNAKHHVSHGRRGNQLTKSVDFSMKAAKPGSEGRGRPSSQARHHSPSHKSRLPGATGVKQSDSLSKSLLNPKDFLTQPPSRPAVDWSRSADDMQAVQSMLERLGVAGPPPRTGKVPPDVARKSKSRTRSAEATVTPQLSVGGASHHLAPPISTLPPTRAVAKATGKGSLLQRSLEDLKVKAGQRDPLTRSKQRSRSEQALHLLAEAFGDRGWGGGESYLPLRQVPPPSPSLLSTYSVSEGDLTQLPDQRF